MRDEIKAFSFLAMLSIVVLASIGVEARELGAIMAGHNTITCDDDNEAIAVPLADSGGNAVSRSANDVSFIATSETEVRIFSKNGEAASEGIKLCAGTGTGCVAAVDLPGPAELWQCYAATDVDITVIGSGR
jgi:preprotein translocase subunit SecF